MKRVFADAFFYIAVLNRNDAAHAKAMELVEAGTIEAVTTVAVLLEVADAMSVPGMRVACGKFIDGLVAKSQTLAEALTVLG